MWIYISDNIFISRNILSGNSFCRITNLSWPKDNLLPSSKHNLPVFLSLIWTHSTKQRTTQRKVYKIPTAIIYNQINIPLALFKKLLQDSLFAWLSTLLIFADNLIFLPYRWIQTKILPHSHIHSGSQLRITLALHWDYRNSQHEKGGIRLLRG